MYVSSFSFHREKEETKLYFLLKRVCTEEILLYPSASAISCSALPVWWSGEGRVDDREIIHVMPRRGKHKEW